MVVASPMPTRPSLQARRTITSVWRVIVVIASLWARMVGRSTRMASIDSIMGEACISIPVGSVLQRFCPGFFRGRLIPLRYALHHWGAVMELRHLRYFQVLGKTLNFTRAAERLHIAQPPLAGRYDSLKRNWAPC